jgi:hypothetical protein
MTKYPLEWGWDQLNNEKSSTGSEWKPKPTLLGGHDGDVDVAAVGDLKCQGGYCSQGGSYGTTATHQINGNNLCRSCAVKWYGLEGLSGSEQDRFLKKFEIPGQ